MKSAFPTFHSRSRTTCTAVLAFAAGLAVCTPALADPISSEFTYQGNLGVGGVPSDGVFDLRFRMFDAAAVGAQVGPTLCVDNLAVTGGLVSTSLDFGSVFTGDGRYLEIEVRVDTGTGCEDGSGWEVLLPRQPMTAAPYASHALTATSAQTALNATNAANATNATNAVNATTATTASDSLLFGGQNAAFYQNAANLTGTLASGRLVGTYTGALTFNNATNAFTGIGSGLTSLSASALASGTVPDGRLAGTYTGSLVFSNAANAFTGNGAGLTALSATALTTGTVADARLSTNVAMRNAANTFGVGPTVFTGDLGIGRTPSFVFDIGGAAATSDRFSVDLTTANQIRFGNLANDADTAVMSSFGHIDLVIDANANTTNRAMRVLRDGPTGTGTEMFSVAESGDAAFNLTQLFVDASTARVGFGTATPVRPLQIMAKEGLQVGSSATGRTSLYMDISADSDGYASIQAVQTGGTLWGDLVLSALGGRVSVASAAPGDASLYANAAGRGSAITAESSVAGAIGLVGMSTATTLDSVGGAFYADSNAGTAVYALATANTGVTYGVRGYSDSNAVNAVGVYGQALRSGANFGVYGMATGGSAFGVYSNGKLGASGTKSFMIDHPLDPENKFLLHYSMESPEVLNVYTGVASLDGLGEVWITLPDYYESINIEPRYLLTSIGGPAPMLHVAEEIEGNRFKVAGGAPNAKVSWEVKAKRNDRFVVEYGAPSERAKVDGEKGTYLRPELYGLPDERRQGHTNVRNAPAKAVESPTPTTPPVVEHN